MNELILEQTPKTPQIDLNHLTGDLIFFGKSIPENAAKIYEPVLNWVKEYIQEARPITNLRLNLEYYNTASTIWFTKIFKMLLRIKESDYVIILHLYLSIRSRICRRPEFPYSSATPINTCGICSQTAASVSAPLQFWVKRSRNCSGYIPRRIYRKRSRAHRRSSLP